MDTSITRGMCRCCASEGAFKDIKSSYTWMGEEEVYADMLKECFDVHLSSTPTDQYGGICEVCITQLRNASNFKKQVLRTEDQLKRLEGKFFTPGTIKIEYQQPEDSQDNTDDNDDTEGYSGNEFDVPIKSEVIEDKPKKRTRATTSRAAKKPKATEADASSTREQETKKAYLKIQPRSQISLARKKIITITPKKKTVEIKKKTEIDKHRDNLVTIMQCSNATPIRKHGGIGYMCCYCNCQFDEAGKLKQHTVDTHDISANNSYLNNLKMANFVIKLDVTDLQCKLCNENINNLDKLIEHLTNKHDKQFHTDIKDHILPFRFDDAILRCVVCTTDFNNFKVLLEHMNCHYRNHVCEVCGRGFVNRINLVAHSYRHRTGVFTCPICDKVFDTRMKQKDHERAIHVNCNKRSKCAYCGEKFTDYTKKNIHEVKMHGVKAVVLKCLACDKTFDNQRSLTVHKKMYHLMEKRVATITS